jgi:ATP-binding cassette, subfamily G (WHITE), member 2, PDR
MKERATRSLADRQEDVDHRNAIMSVDVAPLNPFLALDCPALNPKSSEFSSKLWFESITELHRREPDKYPSRATSVSYRDLSVHGYKTSTDYQHTFGNYPAALLHKAFGRGKTQVTILSNVDGLAKQGEMLLVLGRPGSGCSTLLKTLAGEMHSLHLGNTSDVRYNGKVSWFSHDPDRVLNKCYD